MTPEAIEWLTPHRAHEGEIARPTGKYFNHGRPVVAEQAPFLVPSVSALTAGRVQGTNRDRSGAKWR